MQQKAWGKNISRCKLNIDNSEVHTSRYMLFLMNKQIGKKNTENVTRQNTVIRAVCTHFSKKKKKLNRKFKQPVCINVVVICLGGCFCLVWLFFVSFNKIRGKYSYRYTSSCTRSSSIISVSLVANCVTPRLEPQLCGSQLCWCVLQELSWCFQPISGHNSVLLPREGAKNKTQEKQVVLNTTAHHLLTDALPTPEQWSTPHGQLAPVYILNICMGWNIHLATLGQLSWPFSLSASCASPHWQSKGIWKILDLE